MKLEYFINLDERGEFYADVRRDGVTIWETHGEVFDDGWMLDKNDVRSLRNYLVELGLADDGETLIKGN